MISEVHSYGDAVSDYSLNVRLCTIKKLERYISPKLNLCSIYLTVNSGIRVHFEYKTDTEKSQFEDDYKLLEKELGIRG